MPKKIHFSASQKAQIALEILKEEKTINQISSEFGVHPNVLYRWKKQTLENLPKLFEDENKGDRLYQAITYKTPAQVDVAKDQAVLCSDLRKESTLQ